MFLVDQTVALSNVEVLRWFDKLILFESLGSVPGGSYRYGFVCELADDTSADGLPDGALFANWAASVKLKLLEEESPGQVFWASPLDSHCIFLPLSLLDPTSNFWISWLQVNTYPAQRLMACFWVLARRYRTQMVSGDQH